MAAAANKVVTVDKAAAAMNMTTAATAINVVGAMKAAAAMKRTTTANVTVETMCGGGSNFGGNDEGAANCDGRGEQGGGDDCIGGGKRGGDKCGK